MSFAGADYEDKFLSDLVDFVANDKFQSMFEGFFLEHATKFSSDEEHKLLYYDIYQQFHEMFEGQLDTFCEKKNMTQAEFMQKCRAAQESDQKAKHYITILLSSVEYETFVKLMRIMRPVAESRIASAAEAKQGTAGRGSTTGAGVDEVALADAKYAGNAGPAAAAAGSPSAKASAKGGGGGGDDDDDDDGFGGGPAAAGSKGSYGDDFDAPDAKGVRGGAGESSKEVASSK